MIEDGRHIADHSTLTARICIVGSGAAGITLAWHLQNQYKDKEIILLDSGRDFDAKLPYNPELMYVDKKRLYTGNNKGIFANNEPEFLTRPHYRGQSPSERELYFGGTTTHWGGQCRPLHDSVFQGQDGYPAWPIDYCDLKNYYDQAADFCKLPSRDFSAKHWADVLKVEVPDLDDFEVAMYQFMGEDYLNFAKREVDGETLDTTQKIRVIRNATLLEIKHQCGHVQSVKVGSMTMDEPPKAATEFEVKADAFVLASGAVANARLMLLSDVGNDHDNVGRYFMCHPLSHNTVDFYNTSYLTDPELYLMQGRDRNGQAWRSPEGVTVTGRFIPDPKLAAAKGIGLCWFWADSSEHLFEQSANRDSRISLTPPEQTDDVFGQRLTSADWQFTDREENTFKETKKLFEKAVDNRGGRVVIRDWDTVKKRVVVNGHHIGTTRMSDKAEDGVVDKDLRCHGLDNFYVAGSSVFPSAGISNPTFTIIALSIRLAAHLKCAV